MNRYIHSIDYKLCVPSDVPLFKTDSNSIVGNIQTAKGELLDQVTTYSWVKSLIENGTFFEHFDYDYNTIKDTEYDKNLGIRMQLMYDLEDCSQEADAFLDGWNYYNAPYHILYYWHEHIYSDSVELSKEDIVQHYKNVFKFITDAEELCLSYLTFEGYYDSKRAPVMLCFA